MTKKDKSAAAGVIEGYYDQVDEGKAAKKWDSTGIENWSWKKQPHGACVPTAGNAVENITGGWRTEKPIWHEDKCTHCLICWIDCPDAAIRVKNEKWDSFDYDHCKGCGVCAKVCPAKAISMVNERGEG